MTRTDIADLIAEFIEETKERLDKVKRALRKLDAAYVAAVDAEGVAGTRGDTADGTDIAERARRTWIAHIECALDDDHTWLGRNGHTAQDTVDELEGGEEEE